MAIQNSDFADYCCELLSDLGPCVAKRMFGGWGISVDGLTVAILANHQPELREKLRRFRATQSEQVMKDTLP